MSAAPASIARLIARELNVEEKQVTAAIDLIGEGATVPFIARYRKERTGGLDDTQLRHLAARLTYLTDLNARRDTVLKSIREQGKLTPALEKQINAAETKVALEDLYAPFKQKRRTRATIAREAGLAPLAEQLLANPNLNPAEIAAKFISKSKGVASADEALEGARHIVVETLAETPEIVGAVREKMWAEGKVRSAVARGKAEEGAKFSDYFDFDQPIEQLPSHRLLALLRGEKEGVLKLGLDIPHANDRP
ncbi:MAG: Tex-like N-terminal domain-containing protein, partial [Hyphomonas sp.]|nr:Tex-like N-terminal domain-containing protein [Hyphomonas sp.]